MSRRQTSPTRWLVITEIDGASILAKARKLPIGSGILLLTPVPPAIMRRLRSLAGARRLVVVKEGRRGAIRVHGLFELRAALLAGADPILLSPIYPTATHPDWPPMPRMRAATLARLAGRRLIALGGMSERRYAPIARLGFSGWAGVSAFRT